jgi:polysaccharide deacetylase 2 family uncharacterized protein YibQ
LLILFAASLWLGYRIAERIDLVDRDRVVRDTLQDMKRNAATGAPAQQPESSQAPGQSKYASIDEIPGLPKYRETAPGERMPTHEDQVRNRPQLAAAAAQAMWRRNAVPFPDINSRPLVAIVIDDVGIDRPHSRRAWELPGTLTMSFLPYAKDLREQAKAARANGKEIMLHMPMEPTGHADPGPGALLVSMTENEIGRRTASALDGCDGYVGANNHMGSRFTAYKPGMQIVLQQMRARGMMFLDSRTTKETVGDQLAQEIGVPSMNRNVFLDDDETAAAVRRKLAETEEVARRQGFVVAIGHPHETTLQALADWLPTLSAKGMALAPATAALRKRNGWD